MAVFVTSAVNWRVDEQKCGLLCVFDPRVENARGVTMVNRCLPAAVDCRSDGVTLFQTLVAGRCSVTRRSTAWGDRLAAMSKAPKVCVFLADHPMR